MKFSRYCYEHLDGNKCNDVSIFVLDGDGEIRTLDPLLARQVLSQLSYTPILVVIFYLVQACPTSQWA